jgi:hypothetical protein
MTMTTPLDSPVFVRARLASLITKIDSVEASLPNLQRDASGVCDVLAIERLELARMDVSVAKAEILREVRAMLATCPVHGSRAAITACGECLRSARAVARVA